VLKSNRLIALDIGASKVVVAEFNVARAGMPELLSYGIGALEAEGSVEADLSAYIVAAIRDIMRTKGIRPAPVYMTISGQTVFPRFVKLPAVSRDKLLPIIRYEAEQNVPFPIDEVVWDYQILGAQRAQHDDVNVMLVAVKTENVTRLTDCVVAAGLEPDVVDVAPMALYNAVRFNHPDLQGCTMVLDIGARSSSLIFIEEDLVFSRSIPVAGGTITQEIMKELGVQAREAEALKRQHAFVAFGGVYAGPENDTADRVSKIVRNVITRLHAEVNRSINFYRSQQGGSPPSLVLLTGGSSAIPHTDTFFREKLKVEVDYLNPFANIPVSERISSEDVERDLPLLGEVAGLAIRRSMSCPIEINLLPPALVERKAFRRRQPYFAASAVGLVLVMLCWWSFFLKMKDVWQERTRKLDLQLDIREETDRDLTAALRSQQQSQAKHDDVVSIVRQRSRWIDWLQGLNDCMLEGAWLRSVDPVMSGGKLCLEVSGRGFDDRLKKNDSSEATAIEVLRDRLRQHPLFSDKTEITAVPAMAPGAYARDFTILVVLEEGEQLPGTEAVQP
jgi:type IV pilus assembly protein PilM